MKIVRIAALASAWTFATSAAASAAAVAPHDIPVEKPIRSIAISVNDAPLETDTPPKVIGGRVLVPMRDVFNALGIGVQRAGNVITARLPTATVDVTVGSSFVKIDGKSVPIGTQVVEAGSAVYVPLQLLVVAFGVQATYDQRGAKIDIVSDYIGRQSGAEQSRADGGSDVQGVVSALDLDSAPPSLTVVRGGTSRTVSINSDAKLWVEDVTIHSQVKGIITDVRVGDAVHAILSRDGRVLSLFDFYRSTSGAIAALSPASIALESGRVITPSANTEILLNSEDARLSDLHPGDYVTVRSNPESGELRQIVASRTLAAVTATATAKPGTPSPTVISSVTTSLTRPLRAGESFSVTLHGTPNGRATFDIGDLLLDQPMHEMQPGVYSGSFTIPERFNLTQVPVYGKLSLGSSSAPRTQGNQTLSAATTPPVVGEVEPSAGETINNTRPSIYATYAAPTEIPISQSSVSVSVNGHDVTASTTRTATFVSYSPGVDLAPGPVSVTVRVSDTAGNSTTRTWNFTIQTR